MCFMMMIAIMDMTKDESAHISTFYNLKVIKSSQSRLSLFIKTKNKTETCDFNLETESISE